MFRQRPLDSKIDFEYFGQRPRKLYVPVNFNKHV
jgi:hypothetical protein